MGAPEVRGGGLTGSFKCPIYGVVRAYVVVVDSPNANGVKSGGMNWCWRLDDKHTR
jgi:hypothetical protein